MPAHGTSVYGTKQGLASSPTKGSTASSAQKGSASRQTAATLLPLAVAWLEERAPRNASTAGRSSA